ncbi:hypothetical protein DSECCO2_615310 [anaerobic digester metagenome]
MEELKGDFPFITHIDVVDVINGTNEYLERTAAKYGKFFALKSRDFEDMTMREEFLSIPNGRNADSSYQEVFKLSTQDEVNNALAEDKLQGEKFYKNLNGLCEKCADKDVCIEMYGVKKK